MVDVAHPDHEAQIAAVHRILGELGYDDIPELLVFNKIDRLDDEQVQDRLNGHNAIGISALHERGIQTLLERIDEALPPAVRMRRPPTRLDRPAS
jgi:GTP-binding protein HflX